VFIDMEDNRLESLEKEIVQLNQEKEELNKQLEEEKAKRMKIEYSFLWRIIKPLRNLWHHIKKEQDPSVYWRTDQIQYKNSELLVIGWIFSPVAKIDSLGLYAQVGKRRINLSLRKNILRKDLLKVYDFKNALNCGFQSQQKLGTRRRIHLFLEYKVNQKTNVVKLGSIKRSLNETIKIYSKLISKNNIKKALLLIKKGKIKDLIRLFLLHTSLPEQEKAHYIFYKDLEQRYFCMDPNNEQKSIYKEVDIIIPVYNGLQFFDKLFAGIEKTRVPYNLIIIDDRSPDERVFQWLQEYAQNHINVTLLRNEENLGFVKTVNKGLAYSKNDIVLLNTDVQVPNEWLERLMRPIWINDRVASATPYTNSGNICSFPLIGKDNHIFDDLDVHIIDEKFARVKPQYTELPTGVGFCMAMNKKAIEKVGLLDDATFGKGYGEENDWCQRAILCNMKNVMVENLYVFHNHGGSFASKEKQHLLDVNMDKLKSKYPNYLKEVSEYFQRDSLYDLREYLYMSLICSISEKVKLYFNHQLKGGADSYLIKKTEEALSNREFVFIIEYDYKKGIYLLKCDYLDKTTLIYFENWEELLRFFDRYRIDEIIINELVTYPRLYQCLDKIKRLAKQKNAKLIMLLHDFFAICPATNLLNDQGEFCRIPELSICDQCMKNNKFNNYLEYGTIKEWRDNWKDFLKHCDEIRTFSNDSKSQLEKAYGNLENVTVVPHVVDYIIPFHKQYKMTESINIGLLGNLSLHKGLKIVKKLLDYIENNQLNINIILLGVLETPIQNSHLIVSGRYTPEMLPTLILKYDIDLFFISSIWPETFSYTTEEVIKLNMPIAVFDMGAPAERVKNYDKGIILDNADEEYLVSKMLSLAYQEQKKQIKIQNKKKTLCVVLEYSYAVRYRIEHLQEQLLYIGEKSDIITLEQLRDQALVDINQYERVIIYRCMPDLSIIKLINSFHERGKQVWYEIDDLIFDYSLIKEFEFVKNSGDTNYQEYCSGVRKVLEMCDGVLTSTTVLKAFIERRFPDKPVVIHRNIASDQMIGLSLKAIRKQSYKKQEKILLGYFSGSWTHNKDFEKITDILSELFDRYSFLELVIGGALRVPETLAKYQSRIQVFEFKNWRELPAEIAKVDINLMPLEDTIFHACKSENKWLEAALVKVPTVASYNEELARIIENGKTGFLCKTKEEWLKVLDELILNRKLVKEVGENANQKAMEEYTSHCLESEVKNILRNGEK
jgi:GT2 family glycosyltransferase